MHCDQCGKENRSGSKFCRHCGNTFEDGANGSVGKKKSHSAITWKSPIVIIVVALVIIAGLAYGGTKAYAYYQVASKINDAKKLQEASDFKGSIDILAGLENRAFTVSQKNKIEAIKADDQKFIKYKTSFDNAIAIKNSTSTVSLSSNLQSALTELQSIESSYPDFKNVQTEMTKVQNALVTALQEEAQTSKKAAADASALAEKNRAAATAAQAAKDRAEANAVRAQSQVESAASTARSAEVAKSFKNQLLSAYNNLKNGDAYYSEAMGYHNSGNDSLALVVFAKANAVYGEVGQTATGLNSTFTGMPQSYVDAANNLVTASSYNIKATNSVIDGMGSSYSTASNTNYYSNLGDQYRNLVGSFLRNN